MSHVDLQTFGLRDVVRVRMGGGKCGAQDFKAGCGHTRRHKIRSAEFDRREDEFQNLTLLLVADVVVTGGNVRTIRQRLLFGSQQKTELAVSQKRRLRVERVVAVADALDLAALKRDNGVGDAR